MPRAFSSSAIARRLVCPAPRMSSGLAPAEAGGGNWIDWVPIARSLANGCDPEHPEYWGDPFDQSQRLVELAAIGFALRLVPDRVWQPLLEREKPAVAAYLVKGHACGFVDNNWKFFRLREQFTPELQAAWHAAYDHLKLQPPGPAALPRQQVKTPLRRSDGRVRRRRRGQPPSAHAVCE